jgi:hypothetical protein
MSTRILLSSGLYEPELPREPQHWVSRTTACSHFLEAVRHRYPHVLDDLDTFPYAPSDLLAQAEESKKAEVWLKGWAVRHRLVSDLILRAAVWTVLDWRLKARPSGERRWVVPPTTWLEPATEITPISPNPLIEQHSDWTARAEQAWNTRVRELRAQGCTLTRRLNAAHFDWLARLLVGGESAYSIAKSSKVAPQAVAQATKKVARLIKLPLSSPDAPISG